ncbi:MAG: hypothetical protein ABSG32_25405 [Terriglobia bacterium]|jgi:hypothetical protein
MPGTRTAQDKLFAVGPIFPGYGGRGTLYEYMAYNRHHLHRGEDFPAPHWAANGRISAPSSLAISILFLRA